MIIARKSIANFARAIAQGTLFLVIGAVVMPSAAESNMKKKPFGSGYYGSFVVEYTNFLYLTELFGRPTSVPYNGRYCVDTLDEKKIHALQNDIGNVIRKNFWDLGCSPVKPSFERNRTGTFDVRLRYIKLDDRRNWIDQFKAAVFSEKADTETRLSESRQLELSKLHKSELNLFRGQDSLEHRLAVLRAIHEMTAKSIQESKQTDTIGEIVFLGS